MNKQEFFKHYPVRKIDSNKFDNGRILLISGSYGMAGAAILNIKGARSVGTSYIRSLVPENIYPIVSTNEITTVYYPDNLKNNNYLFDLNILDKVDAIGIGSGLNNHPFHLDYLKTVLTNSNVPIVIDACSLDDLANNEELYKLNNKMILTPHLGEFSRLTHLTIQEILNDKENIASNFAKNNNVTLVLKGNKSLIVSNTGVITINESGNEALARAGSGDILTGMITGLCSLYDNYLTAVKDGVWLHGYLCDEAINEHSKEIFDLSKYPEYANSFFFNH